MCGIFGIITKEEKNFGPILPEAGRTARRVAQGGKDVCFGWLAPIENHL